jgi:hypothetical protein
VSIRRGAAASMSTTVRAMAARTGSPKAMVDSMVCASIVVDIPWLFLLDSGHFDAASGWKRRHCSRSQIRPPGGRGTLDVSQP